MISVCIPSYNFDIRPLVKALGEQLGELQNRSGNQDPGMEILVVDDASESNFREMNREVCAQFNYRVLAQNAGRARIRNLFLEEARNPYLLFLDCDSLLVSDTFLSDYLELARQGKYRVLCGGRIYPRERPGRERMLRWKYGHERESQTADVRKQDPNRSFMTNNFMVHRSILEKHPFDESLIRYGHEDTLFGFRLKQAGIAVHHVENPVLNGDLEQNREFLQKTAAGVENLLQILNKVDDPEALAADITLLRAYATLGKSRLSGFVFFLFRLTQPLTEFLLARGWASIRLFDSYKLGILVRRARSDRKT